MPVAVECLLLQWRLLAAVLAGKKIFTQHRAVIRHPVMLIEHHHAPAKPSLAQRLRRRGRRRHRRPRSQKTRLSPAAAGAALSACDAAHDAAFSARASKHSAHPPPAAPAMPRCARRTQPYATGKSAGPDIICPAPAARRHAGRWRPRRKNASPSRVKTIFVPPASASSICPSRSASTAATSHMS